MTATNSLGIKKLAAPSIVFLSILTSCTAGQKDEMHEPVVPLSTTAEVGEPSLLSKAGTPTIDDMIAAAEPRVEEESAADAAAPVGDEITNATTAGVPMEINAPVQEWIEYFTGKDRERFQRFLERGEKYKPMITAVLKDQGIPTELYYQAMIESGFTVDARSSAQAVGIWQFISGTGKRYGLRTDSYVDERRDPMRATIAAALYMQDLYNVFQSWYLALGAYNAGEGRILGAIMRGKSRDFWELVRRKQLPAETMNYIPKFLAATSIGHNLRKYGFDDVTAEVMPPLAAVAVAAPVRLSDIARLSGVSLATLRSYNPHILRGITPPGNAQYRIWVPKDQAGDIEAQKDKIAALRLPGLQNYVQESNSTGRGKASTSPRFHRVKRGENLALIAKKYGMGVSQLKAVNNLKGNVLFAGKLLKVGSTSVAASAPSATVANAAGRSKSGASHHYRVQAGDSLDAIARRFGISLDRLKQMNQLKRNRIYAGQVLRVKNRQG